jgi:hypothetical protein
VAAEVLADPTGLPLSRVLLSVADGIDSARLVDELRAGSPSIHVLIEGRQLVLELVPLEDDELTVVLERLATIVSRLRS